MNKIKVGIIGGAGYTAGELIRILMYHPFAEISFIHSESQTGKAVYEIHKDLIGETNLYFTNKIEEQVDVWFLCMGHGRSKVFLENNPPSSSIKIIDLSNEFRLSESSDGFIYGLPEFQKNKIQQANKIANPGCFATAIQLALLPLAKAGLLKNSIHVNAITGVTGAGQKPTDKTHFSWRDNNVSIYKAFNHQHLAEIKQSVKMLQPDFEKSINFIPMRGNFSRGIFASIYTEIEDNEIDYQKLYEDYYKDSAFTHYSLTNPSLKQVINTNKCIIHTKIIDNNLLIISMIDNLLKGASGQAVQNMNLLFGFGELTGLQLKATAF